jgi:ParB-like chromosome segregation protein Spo0J
MTSAVLVMIDDIAVGSGRREIDMAAVKKLAQSIEQIGLQHPVTVTVKRKGDGYLLVAGRHRLEACKAIGRDHVMANIVTMTKDESRLWEISENLHRADLSKLERDEQIAEWIEITERLASQSATPKTGKGGHQPGGVNAAARELGIDKDDAHRAIKVAGLTEEAKEAARDAGLDNNRSALLAVAKEDGAKAQVTKVKSIKAAKAEKPARSQSACDFDWDNVKPEDFGDADTSYKRQAQFYTSESLRHAETHPLLRVSPDKVTQKEIQAVRGNADAWRCLAVKLVLAGQADKDRVEPVLVHVALNELVRAIGEATPETVATGVMPDQVDAQLDNVGTVMAWLNRYASLLETEREKKDGTETQKKPPVKSGTTVGDTSTMPDIPEFLRRAPA